MQPRRFPSKYSLATWNLCSDTTYLQEVLPLLFFSARTLTPTRRSLGSLVHLPPLASVAKTRSSVGRV